MTKCYNETFHMIIHMIKSLWPVTWHILEPYYSLLIDMKHHQGFINVQYTASPVVSFIWDPYYADLYHPYLDIIWFICVSSCLTQ